MLDRMTLLRYPMSTPRPTSDVPSVSEQAGGRPVASPSAGLSSFCPLLQQQHQPPPETQHGPASWGRLARLLLSLKDRKDLVVLGYSKDSI